MSKETAQRNAVCEEHSNTLHAHVGKSICHRERLCEKCVCVYVGVGVTEL